MRTAIAASLLFFCVSARAAEPAAPPEKVHRVERLGDHSFVIFGKGGNVGVFVGDRDAVLVDTQIDKLAPELAEAVATVTNKPLKLLINTHYHLDHVGGNPVFAPRVGEIVAHANVPARMERIRPSSSRRREVACRRCSWASSSRRRPLTSPCGCPASRSRSCTAAPRTPTAT